MCKELLEMGRASKIAAVLSVPGGLLFGGIPIYMEETGGWATTGSLIYFLAAGAVLTFTGRKLWPLTRLAKKSDPEIGKPKGPDDLSQKGRP